MINKNCHLPNKNNSKTKQLLKKHLKMILTKTKRTFTLEQRFLQIFYNPHGGSVPEKNSLTSGVKLYGKKFSKEKT